MKSKKLQNQIKLLQSKQSDEWGTPQWLFDQLNNEFKFDLDAAASDTNFKCKKYYTINDNALQKLWFGNVWCNPPYSLTGEFLKKAHKELELGHCNIAVFLTFSNTDTKWFHDYVLNKSEIRFIKGRLKFEGKNSEGKIVNNSAMRPSMISILGNYNKFSSIVKK